MFLLYFFVYYLAFMMGCAFSIPTLKNILTVSEFAISLLTLLEKVSSLNGNSGKENTTEGTDTGVYIKGIVAVGFRRGLASSFYP